VGVGSGSVPGEAELIHPLMKTMPVTRIKKIPITYPLFNARSSNIRIFRPDSLKYISAMTG
jgi:hypothetical protein